MAAAKGNSKELDFEAEWKKEPRVASRQPQKERDSPPRCNPGKPTNSKRTPSPRITKLDLLLEEQEEMIFMGCRKWLGQ
jgi:hypothetical protein